MSDKIKLSDMTYIIGYKLRIMAPNTPKTTPPALPDLAPNPEPGAPAHLKGLAETARNLRPRRQGAGDAACL